MHIAIVGAGPAGLLAAEVLAAAGHRVSVFDQRRSPARKFMLAGRGGLNITHSEPLDAFLDRYGPERQHLEPAIRSFSPEDLRAWCAGLGHETFVGTSKRVFPAEFRAVPLLRSWLRRLHALGVTLHTQHRWTGWGSDQALSFTSPEGPVEVHCDAAVLALGGASWPRVGSDGSWQSVLRARGIDVRPLQSANCGVDVAWSPVMIKRFAGEPLKNAAVSVRPSTGEGPGLAEPIAVRGDPIITSRGLEGGPIYAHSRLIRERLAVGLSDMAIDLFPDLDLGALEQRMRSKRGERDSTAKWLRRCGVSPAGASLMREAHGSELPRDAAAAAKLAKAVPITVTGMAAIERAISSAGGVAWEEVDETFQLRSLPNVYTVGEMLDWEAPTGGYLLQACFSTAHAAATAIHAGT